MPVSRNVSVSAVTESLSKRTGVAVCHHPDVFPRGMLTQERTDMLRALVNLDQRYIGRWIG